MCLQALGFGVEQLAHPCRRFTTALADDGARFAADADRYSFIVVDLHHLLPAGLPAHSHRTVERRSAALVQMLGASRPATAAVVRSLREAGAIAERRGAIAVRDRRPLEAAACECYGLLRTRNHRLLGRALGSSG